MRRTDCIWVPLLALLAGCHQPRVQPGVGMENVKFGVKLDVVEYSLGRAIRVKTSGTVTTGAVWTLEYPDIGLHVVITSSGVTELNFGDPTDPLSPMVRRCKTRTDQNIGMGSSLAELKKAYGDPAALKPDGSRQTATYPALGATFTLASDRIIGMRFRRPDPS